MTLDEKKEELLGFNSYSMCNDKVEDCQVFRIEILNH